MTRNHRQTSGDPAATSKAVPVRDAVTEAMFESFPASDPPSWMGTRIGAPPGREGTKSRRAGSRRTGLPEA